MKYILILCSALTIGCASIEMPIAGSSEVIKFKGFASDMTITLPATDTEPERTINISAHATEGPVLEALKSIAPFAALAVGQ
jgi:hypothetical protein